MDFHDNYGCAVLEELFIQKGFVNYNVYISPAYELLNLDIDLPLVWDGTSDTGLFM